MILDCDYSIDDHEKKGLVVKWFFANKRTQVYQWIPSTKPTSLGILKGKVNLEYVADGDEYKEKRALQIIRPTTELSGTNSFEKNAQKNSHSLRINNSLNFFLVLRKLDLSRIDI